MRIHFNVLIIAIALLVSCGGAPDPKSLPEPQNNSRKITVSFTIDDSLISITDHYQVIFSNGNDSSKASIRANEIILPEIKYDTGYTITFKHAEYTLSFQRVTKKMIMTGQDMDWKFGIDNRPFNNLLGLLSTEEFKTDKKTRQLQYLTFDPLENGDGISALNKIE